MHVTLSLEHLLVPFAEITFRKRAVARTLCAMWAGVCHTFRAVPEAAGQVQARERAGLKNKCGVICREKVS